MAGGGEVKEGAVFLSDLIIVIFSRWLIILCGPKFWVKKSKSVGTRYELKVRFESQQMKN